MIHLTDYAPLTGEDDKEDKSIDVPGTDSWIWNQIEVCGWDCSHEMEVVEAQIVEIGKLITADKHPVLNQTLLLSGGQLSSLWWDQKWMFIWAWCGPGILFLLLITAVNYFQLQSALIGSSWLFLAEDNFSQQKTSSLKTHQEMFVQQESPLSDMATVPPPPFAQ